MTLEQINQKYQSLCTQIGDINYKVRQHKALLDSLYTQVDKLNELAAAIQSSEADQASKPLEDKEA